MTATVHLRPAHPDDAELLGEMLVEAGGGMFEVLLDGVVPGVTPAQMMAEAVREPESGFSYRRTTVVEADGVPVGSLTAFPADQFGNDTSSLFPPSASFTCSRCARCWIGGAGMSRRLRSGPSSAAGISADACCRRRSRRRTSRDFPA